MSVHDAAIRHLVESDPVGVRVLVESQVERVGDCLLWTGPLDTSGSACVMVSFAGRDVPLAVHRLVYALERGVEFLPAGRVMMRRNDPCIHRVCLDKRCVESGHLVRMRRYEIGFGALVPSGMELPVEHRFLAERRIRGSLVKG